MLHVYLLSTLFREPVSNYAGSYYGRVIPSRHYNPQESIILFLSGSVWLASDSRRVFLNQVCIDGRE